MVEVVPFTGFLYNQDKTGPADRVTAPPYDVISPQHQEELYERSPHNVVRLILGKIFPEDNEKDNRYTRSKKVFEEWIRDGILVRDRKPALYVYCQDYESEGKKISRIGFFARVRIEDFSTGNICPHEFTLAKAKKDRTHLLEACRANFSPIFGLFSDAGGEIDRRLKRIENEQPLAEVSENGIDHRFWRLEDEDTISFISKSFSDKKVFIADGHHRYETALGFHKNHGHEVEDSAHVMMFLTNLDSQSLSIFPIHRLIKSPAPFNKEEFLARIGKHFDIETLPAGVEANGIKSALEASGKEGIVFCAHLGKGESYLLKLRSTEDILPLLEKDEAADLQVLGVCQLHTLVIKSILRIDTKKPENQQYITYKADPREALKLIDSGEFDLVFLMNPTPIDQVRSLAEKGIRLPQKATFFYPKLLSGLVINKFGP